MKYRQLTILLPCHSLEDFPTHHEGDAAQGLLAHWTALWHPALLAAAGSLPNWYRGDSPPSDIAEHLVVVPSVTLGELPTGFSQRAEDAGAVLIRDELRRDVIVAQALAHLDGGDGGIDPDLAADFLALGYCYLQIELLTRQLRYSSSLDQSHFQTQVVQGATAALQGDAEEARRKLTTCFDLLSEERDHYYQVEAFILDLTMVAPTTIGPSLRATLAAPTPVNLIVTADVLGLVAEKEPATFAALRQAVQEGRAAIIGGEAVERCTSLMPCEALLAEFVRGLTTYDALLGRMPSVYTRRRFGLTLTMPQLLNKLGFEAALHVALDDGVYPEGSQSKVRWEGCDGTAIEAIARPPLDANKPEAYLKFAVKMGESMDLDHVATMCLAHWAGVHQPWLDDLRRIARHSKVLGQFVTFEEYFRQTVQPAHQDRFQIDQYRSPYLRQAVGREQVDPISSSVRYWRRRTTAQAVANISFLAGLLAGQRGSHDTAGGDQERDPVDALFGEVDCSLEGAESETLDARLQQASDEALARFAAHLPRQSGSSQTGCLIVNPHSFTCRTGVDVTPLAGLPLAERPIYAAAESADAKHIVADVPPLGFVWATPAATAPRAKKGDQPLADACLLRNEFFEILIDEATGGLRAIYEYGARGNRLSQQVAYHFPAKKRAQSGEAGEESDEGAVYSVMAADSIQTTVATPLLGEIVSRGRLVDRQGQTLAGFRQTFRLGRGGRVLQVAVELEPQIECGPDPWNSYFALRFAWASDAAELWRTVNDTRHRTTARRFEAPLYVEIEDGSNRTAILTGGLPFHRRHGYRMLDSLLIVRGERARSFRFSVGVNLKHPLPEALHLLAPPVALCQDAAPPSPSTSGWLFHLDARNVTATHWEPLYEGDRVAGFRVRLLESGGRSATATLKCFRPVTAARRLNFCGGTISDCTVQDGDIQLTLSAHEWAQLEARW